MISGFSVLALIPARAGSKRMPGKNVAPFAGRPLIQWTAAAAAASRFVDRVVVSSDCPEAISAAVAAGAEAPFVRPSALAQDDTGSADVVAHALEAMDRPFDIVVLLQPTSPLRTAEDIDALVQLLVERRAPAALFVSAVNKPLAWIRTLAASGELAPVADAWPQPGAGARLVRPNGAGYAVWAQRFAAERDFAPEGALGLELPAARAFDIDTPEDFEIAEAVALYAERRRTTASSSAARIRDSLSPSKQPQ